MVFSTQESEQKEVSDEKNQHSNMGVMSSTGNYWLHEVVLFINKMMKKSPSVSMRTPFEMASATTWEDCLKLIGEMKTEIGRFCVGVGKHATEVV